MTDLMLELKERKKLMEETPPEEIKYWFEYTGPLQVSRDFVELYEFAVSGALLAGSAAAK